MARILGLDIGTHAIKAVELRPQLRGFEVVQLRTERIPEDGPPLPELLRDFLQTHGLAKENVVCALPGDRVSIRRLRLPFRDRRRIAQALPFEVEGQSPFELEDVILDWIEVGGDRTHAEVAVTIASRTDIAYLLENLRQADIEPRTVEAEGLVLGNLAAHFDLPGTRLLIDLGHRKTTFCLVIEGRPVAARTVSLGGRAITEAIAAERNLDLSEAEILKCERGIFPSALESGVPGAVTVVDRLAREVARSLGAFEPALRGGAVERVDALTLVGGTAHLHRIDQYLGERVGIPAARLALPADTSLVAGGDPPIFAAGLALALRGTGATRTRMNFRQQEFSQRVDFQRIRERFSVTAGLAAAALILALLGAGIQIVLDSRRADALERLVAQAYTEAQPGKPPPADVATAMRDAVREAEIRADFLGVYGGQLSALDILTEIARRVPKDIDVVVEDMRIDGGAVRIRGFARNVQALDSLETELGDFGPFSEIKVSDIQDEPRRGGYTFQLAISLAGGGDTA
ncbi:MAG: pilus assembly protein PilM [Deltaproteobacteria bacterium]|nr:MAG: pilus assembly protein PilM [Deltaproteobacteria bacterium]